MPPRCAAAASVAARQEEWLFIFFPTIVFGGAQGDFLYTGFEYTVGNLFHEKTTLLYTLDYYLVISCQFLKR